MKKNSCYIPKMLHVSIRFHGKIQVDLDKKQNRFVLFINKLSDKEGGRFSMLWNVTHAIS